MNEPSFLCLNYQLTVLGFIIVVSASRCDAGLKLSFFEREERMRQSIRASVRQSSRFLRSHLECVCLRILEAVEKLVMSGGGKKSASQW